MTGSVDSTATNHCCPHVSPGKDVALSLPMRYGLWLLALLLGTALLLLLGHKFNTFCAPPPDAAVKPQTAQERLIDTVPKEQYQRALAKIAKLEGLLTAGAGRSVPDAHRPVARAHPKPVPKEGKEGKEGKDDKPPEKKKHVRRIGLWGRSDNWSLPEIGAIAKPPPSSEFLLQVRALHTRTPPPQE